MDAVNDLIISLLCFAYGISIHRLLAHGSHAEISVLPRGFPVSKNWVCPIPVIRDFAPDRLRNAIGIALLGAAGH